MILRNLTDHYSTMCNINKLAKSKYKKSVAFYRDKKSFNPESFCDKLDENLGLIVQNQFPLNQENFDNVFN